MIHQRSNAKIQQPLWYRSPFSPALSQPPPLTWRQPLHPTIDPPAPPLPHRFPPHWQLRLDLPHPFPLPSRLRPAPDRDAPSPVCCSSPPPSHPSLPPPRRRSFACGIRRPSELAVSAILELPDDTSAFHPGAFKSCKLTQANC